MKKRLISLFVALTMLLCLIPAAFAATFNAGTYTASANGMNGAVTVEVTFSDDAIVSVQVTEQAETPAIASGALEQIPADIVAHQTLAVDTVTGATITSKAILAAVEDCVKQAGADPDTLRTPVEKDTADVGDRTAHVEVLVIGGGGTGLAAAMSAMDNGAKDVMVSRSCRASAVLRPSPARSSRRKTPTTRRASAWSRTAKPGWRSGKRPPIRTLACWAKTPAIRPTSA